jgi:hypothetical protein
MWTQFPDADADHAHSREVDTLTVAEPPFAPKLPDEFVSVT